MLFTRDPEKVEVHQLRAYADLSNAHILEIGCGDGRLTWRYAAEARRVTAVDLNMERLTTAVEARSPALREKVQFLRVNAQSLCFDNHTFDGVILSWAL